MRLLFTLIAFLCLVNSVVNGQAFSLTECLQYAEKNHPAITNSKTNVAIEGERAEIIRKNALPTVTGSFSQGGSLGRNIDPFSNTIVTNGIGFNSVAISGSVPIYNGFRQRYERGLQELKLKDVRLEVENVILQREIEITRLYYGSLLQAKAIQLKEKQIRDIAVQSNRINGLIVEGQLPTTARDELSVQLINEQNALLQFNNEFKNGLLDLETAIFWQSPRQLQIDTTTNNLPLIDAKKINQPSVQQNPTYLKSQNLIGISRYNGEITLTQFKPTVSASANIGTAYSTAAPAELTLFRQFNTNFRQFVGFSVNLPIYSKGQRRNYEKINALTTLNAEQSARLIAYEFEQVIDRLTNDLLLSQQQIRLLEDQVKVAKKVYDAANERYVSGLINFFELSQWQIKYFETELSVKTERLRQRLILDVLKLY